MTKKQFAEGYPKTYKMFTCNRCVGMSTASLHKRILTFVDVEFDICCEPLPVAIEGKKKAKFKVQISKNEVVFDSYENLFDSIEAARKSNAAMAIKYIEHKIL